MYEDPRCTDYNINAGEFVFRERFITKARLKAYYPKKYKDALGAAKSDWSAPASVKSDDSAEGDIAAVAAMLVENSAINYPLAAFKVTVTLITSPATIN